MSPLTKHTITLNGFEYYLTVLKIPSTLTTFFQPILLISSLTSTTISKARLSIKCKKRNNTRSLNKNWKRAPKHKRNRRNKETGKGVNMKKTIVDIINDSIVKDVYFCDLSEIKERIIQGINLNGKDCWVNKILEKLCLEDNFLFVNQDNIKPRQCCIYGGIHLNTVCSKILVDNFILALCRQT